MGWIGWSESQALATDVNSILLAMEGRTGLLRSIFGSAESATASRAMTGDAWKAKMKRHNRAWRRRGSSGE